MNATMQRVAELKAAGEDHEFFPSTDEIIGAVARDIKERRYDWSEHSNGGLLDIGAGDGRVLVKLNELLAEGHVYFPDLFAIEKSTVHIRKMPKDIIILGTDFMQQTLVDKQVKYTFCNPPYSEYEQWMVKIIRESTASYTYLVVPRRWRDSVKIKHAIKGRGCEVESIGEYDFEDADRQARCKVELLRVTKNHETASAFDSILEEMLPELQAFDRDEELGDIPRDDERDREVAESHEGFIDAMVIAYDKEVAALIETYRSAAKVDPRVLKELGVSKHSILTGIRERITGLKHKYWQALFDHFKEITRRLATKQRSAFLESLKDKASIDFTEGNILAMLIWVTKWSNDYFDEQLVDLFRTLSEDCNVERYKSNDRTWGQSRWRYAFDREGRDCYKLEYRIVVNHGGINTSQWSYDSIRGLERRAYELLMDCVTVANNLAFPCGDTPANYEWRPNKQNKIMLDNGEVLMAVRAFKNGNLHIHFNQRVMLAINVEAGRLLGWLKSPREAVDELQVTGDDATFVLDTFGSQFKIQPSSLGLLTDRRKAEPPPAAQESRLAKHMQMELL